MRYPGDMATNTKAGANPQLAQAMRELRRSNAAGKHGDRRLKRRRDRGSAKRAAIREAS